MNHRQTLSAIVLAGGLSARMGQDKALIEIEGVPLLQRTCQVAQQCGATVYVVTPWIDRYQPILDPSIHLIFEIREQAEPLPHGPIVGFAQGLAHIQTEWVLLLACDLPRLEAAVLQNWLPLLAQTAPETIALLPQNPQGWWEPLCGFYRRTCLPELEAYLQQGGRSFQSWLAAASVQELPLPEPEMLLNCNTPADLASLSSKSSSD